MGARAQPGSGTHPAVIASNPIAWSDLRATAPSALLLLTPKSAEGTPLGHPSPLSPHPPLSKLSTAAPVEWKNVRCVSRGGGASLSHVMQGSGSRGTGARHAAVSPRRNGLYLSHLVNRLPRPRSATATTIWARAAHVRPACRSAPRRRRATRLTGPPPSTSTFPSPRALLALRLLPSR